MANYLPKQLKIGHIIIWQVYIFFSESKVARIPTHYRFFNLFWWNFQYNISTVHQEVEFWLMPQKICQAWTPLIAPPYRVIIEKYSEPQKWLKNYTRALYFINKSWGILVGWPMNLPPWSKKSILLQYNSIISQPLKLSHLCWSSQWTILMMLLHILAPWTTSQMSYLR